MEELEYTIKMNKRSLEAQLTKIEQDARQLRAIIESDEYHGYNAMCWVDGHVAEDVTKMATLIAAQRALTDALRMVRKAEQKWENGQERK